METVIALLQGINVGGKHRLPMADLRAILEDLGCEQVRTYIHSGNAVFRSPREDLEAFSREISAGIQARCGFDPKVWLLREAEFREAMDHNPYPTEVGKALHFFFLDHEPDYVDWEKLEKLKAESESYHLHNRVFYLHAPEGIGRSVLADKLGQCIRVPMTARNWNTIRELASMLAS